MGDFMLFRPVLCQGMLLFGLAAPLASFGQFQAPNPEELQMTSDPKAPGAPAVILYREETEDDPHHFCTVYARIKVLTEQGKDAATIHVRYPRVLAFNATGDNSSFSSSAGENHFDAPDINHAGADQPFDTDTFAAPVEVRALEARTIQPDGTVVPLTGSPATLLKKVGNEPNEVTFTLPSVEVGSILEYRYQVRYDRFQSAPEWQIQQPYFVHKAHYLYSPSDQFLPNDVSGAGISNKELKGPHDQVLTDIRTANILPPGKEIGKDATGRYYLDLTDIPAIPQEAYAPPVGERVYQINFYYTYTVEQKEFWQKEMQFWTKDVNRYIAPTGMIKNTAAELAGPSDTPLDKAKKIYVMVQKLTNTDLASDSPTAVSTSIPQGSVETVLERKSGNSREIALLYLALARAVGLDAQPERIASRDEHIFSPQFLSTSQLDGLVIGVTIDGKEIVIDPGEKMAPFQTLYWGHAGSGGVAMTANGKVETIITPMQVNTDNTIVRVGTLNVGPQRTVSGTLKVGFIGQQALEWRQKALRTDANTVKQQLEKAIAAQVPDGVQVHIDRISSLDDPTKQLVAVVQFSGSITDHPGNHLALPRLFFESKETDPFPSEETRTLPVDMHYPAQEEEQITYALPSGFALESAPQDATLKWEDNAAYQLRSKVEGNNVINARVLARGFTLLDASEYGKLRDFYHKVVTADKQQITLNTVQAAGK
jgi:transglutaminase-like putative cysteine protease